MRTIVIAATALLLSGSLAFASPNCLRPDSFKSFTVKDNQTLIVRQGPNDHYTITLAIKCQSLNFALAVGVKQLTSAQCVAPGDRITYSHGGIEQSCIIKSIEPSEVPAPQPD